MHNPSYHTGIDLYYRPEMSLSEDPGANFSKSPSKPRRFSEKLLASPLAADVTVCGDFEPLPPGNFRRCHRDAYVSAFFAGKLPLAESNGLTWTPEFAETVRYTNASLVDATVAALERPDRIAFSPTSGFHHAAPDGGAGFCTFSGQVLAAAEVLRCTTHRPPCIAWIDLDGHYGNSIPDSGEVYRWVPDVIRHNLNPRGNGAAYLANLAGGLAKIERDILTEKVDMVCIAHGADSHEWDDTHGQLSTAEWLSAGRLAYQAVRRCSEVLGRPVPTVLALFGGYRHDAPESVLELHLASTGVALDVLCGRQYAYAPKVSPRVLRDDA